MFGGNDYHYGFDADSVLELKTGVENLYENLKTFITSRMTNVKADIAEVWTGEDEKKFEESFDADINALYNQVLKLRDEVSDNISKIQKTWEDTQNNNASAMSSLGRFE